MRLISFSLNVVSHFTSKIFSDPKIIFILHLSFRNVNKEKKNVKSVAATQDFQVSGGFLNKRKTKLAAYVFHWTVG